MPVEPVAEHFLLGFVAALRIVLRALDVRCDPGHCGSLCPARSELAAHGDAAKLPRSIVAKYGYRTRIAQNLAAKDR